MVETELLLSSIAQDYDKDIKENIEAENSASTDTKDKP